MCGLSKGARLRGDREADPAEGPEVGDHVVALGDRDLYDGTMIMRSPSRAATANSRSA
jgi:hypothetical protein